VIYNIALGRYGFLKSTFFCDMLKKILADYNLLALLLLQFRLGKKKYGFIFPPTDFQLKQNLVAC